MTLQDFQHVTGKCLKKKKKLLYINKPWNVLLEFLIYCINKILIYFCDRGINYTVIRLHSHLLHFTVSAMSKLAMY